MKVTADSTEISASATDAHQPGVCPSWCTVPDEPGNPFHFGDYTSVQLSLPGETLPVRLEHGLSAPGTYVTMVYKDQYLDLTLAEASELADKLATLVRQAVSWPPPSRGTGSRAGTGEAKFAALTAEVLPDLSSAERLQLLGVMDPDDMRLCLAWIAGYRPAVFDASIVQSGELTERLTSLLADDEDAEEPEPYCARCDAKIGIFLGHGPAWRHWRGEGTVDSPAELYGAGHAPEVAWRRAGDL